MLFWTLIKTWSVLTFWLVYDVKFSIGLELLWASVKVSKYEKVSPIVDETSNSFASVKLNALKPSLLSSHCFNDIMVFAIIGFGKIVIGVVFVPVPKGVTTVILTL